MQSRELSVFWRIENFSLLEHFKSIKSAPFSLHCGIETRSSHKFHIDFQPPRAAMSSPGSFELRPHRGDETRPRRINQLPRLRVTFSALMNSGERHMFNPNGQVLDGREVKDCKGWFKLLRNRAAYLRDDSLTFLLQFSSDEPVFRAERLFARTRIPIKRTSFEWRIDFSKGRCRTSVPDPPLELVLKNALNLPADAFRILVMPRSYAGHPVVCEAFLKKDSGELVTIKPFAVVNVVGELILLSKKFCKSHAGESSSGGFTLFFEFRTDDGKAVSEDFGETPFYGHGDANETLWNLSKPPQTRPAVERGAEGEFAGNGIERNEVYTESSAANVPESEISEGTEKYADFHSDLVPNTKNFHSDLDSNRMDFHSQPIVPEDKTFQGTERVADFHSHLVPNTQNFHSDSVPNTKNFHSDLDSNTMDFHSQPIVPEDKTFQGTERVADFHSHSVPNTKNFHSDLDSNTMNFHSQPIVPEGKTFQGTAKYADFHSHFVPNMQNFHSHLVPNTQNFHFHLVPNTQNFQSDSVPNTQNFQSDSVPNKQNLHSDSVRNTQNLHSDSVPNTQNVHSHSVPNTQNFHSQPIVPEGKTFQGTEKYADFHSHFVPNMQSVHSHSVPNTQNFHSQSPIVPEGKTFQETEKYADFHSHFVPNMQNFHSDSVPNTKNFHSDSVPQNFHSDLVPNTKNVHSGSVPNTKNFHSDSVPNTQNFHSQPIVPEGKTFQGTEKYADFHSHFVPNMQNFHSHSVPNTQNFHSQSPIVPDFTLRVGGRSFPVHRKILSASSAVFKAITREKRDSCFQVTDVDADTMDRMLRFVYFLDFGSHDVDGVSRLFAAADKYKIELLKSRCVESLADSLSAKNVCGALSLAHTHGDQALMARAKEFLFRNANLVFRGEGWRRFMKERSELASSIMHEKFLEQQPS